MECRQLEIDQVEAAEIQTQDKVAELNDLQLALIGGGCGETIAI